MQISDIKTAAPQTMIVHPGLFAVVAKVMPRKIGSGQYGDWAMQPITLKDNTGEIHAIIWGRPELSHLAGKEIHLSALNDGNGWKGCMVEDNTYTAKDGSKKTARQIKASGVFLLEEAVPVTQAQKPVEHNGNGAESIAKRNGLPNWAEYLAVVRSAHAVALELEPDGSGHELQTIDRSKTRAAIMNTIIIAYGKKDFIFDGSSDSDMPF